MEAGALVGSDVLGAEKENLKTQQRTCRPGKRVLVDGLRGEEQGAHVYKKVRVGEERSEVIRHEMGRSRLVSRSWSECNVGPGQAFRSLGSEGAAQRSLFGKETDSGRREGGALQELVAKPLNVQRERLGRESGSEGGKLPELLSPMGGPLGFTIKLQRHGRISEASDDLRANAVSAGSFASAGRFSLLGKSNRGDSGGASRETNDLPSFTVSKESSPSVVRTDSQSLLESRLSLRKSFSQPKSVEQGSSADVEKATTEVESVTVLNSAPNAALFETSRRSTPLSFEEDFETTAPLPVRRSSRNRAASGTRDEDPTYTPAQVSNKDMPESKNKRSSRGKTTRKPSCDDVEVAPTRVEKQSVSQLQSHEEEHSPIVTNGDDGKPPRKRAPVTRKASTEAQEESSWSHPKALKKRTSANRSSIGNVQVNPISNCWK